MRPLIAILCSSTLSSSDRSQPRDFANRGYSDAIRRAGGVPLLVPLTDDGKCVRAAIAVAAGLLITGGVDIDPKVYGESRLPQCGEIDCLRDATDRWAIAEACARGLPVLGICRGIQSLAAFQGGTLYQDIPTQLKGALCHQQKAPRDQATHEVRVTPGTLVARIMGTHSLSVNSFHHQAVKDLPAGFRVSAKAPDGVIEAIEATDRAFQIGVQWHPEEMAIVDSPHLTLFRAFVSAAATVIPPLYPEALR
ncbi:MAG: gamma-glutamyl-gamma-aminobutyrate hydrolase family protein [Candidatus Zipacnadales bacterium]